MTYSISSRVGSCYATLRDIPTPSLQAASKQTNFPLNPEQPCEKEAITSNRATLFRLNHELLLNIKRLKPSSGVRAATDIELVEDEMEDQLYVDFFCKLQDGHFELPSMPDIAVRISKAVNNPDTGSDDIARIIQMDPASATRIIHIVNSPAYAGRHHIDSCPDAVTRLGRNVTRNLVLSFVLRNLFRTRHEILRKRMSELWAHSRRVASICHVLARITSELDPDRAMLAGLIHGIGAVPILSASREYPELVENPALLDETVSRLRAQVGALVLRKWDFMNEFTDVALHADNWARDEGDKADYTDLVIISQLHAYVGTPRMQELPRLDLVPAFHKLAQGKLSPQQSMQVLEKSKADIQAVESLLDGG